jgi:hypothetical protein
VPIREAAAARAFCLVASRKRYGQGISSIVAGPNSIGTFVEATISETLPPRSLALASSTTDIALVHGTEIQRELGFSCVP